MEGVPVLSSADTIKALNEKLNKIIQQRRIDPIQMLGGVVKSKEKEEEDREKRPTDRAGEGPTDRAGEGPTDRAREGPTDRAREGAVKTKRIVKKTLRKAAGVVWEDKTMEEWAQDDYRVFCGNIGKEVTDEMLGAVFRRYKSFLKARVVQDRRTGKNRGYGFVSFRDPKDFLLALKQMNGMYVGNRPIKVMKSSWKERDLTSEKNQSLPSDFKTNSQKETNNICINYKFVSQL